MKKPMTPLKLAIMGRLREELDDAISRACTYHNKLRKDAGLRCGDDDVWHDTSFTDVDEYGVRIEWYLTWAYGGEARGEHSIPAAALCDDTYEEAIKAIVQPEIDKAGAAARAKKIANEKYELKTLAELKAKYEGGS